ncbi:b-box zinc finger domain-containing protein [Phthorimaea operculella]|nr:b-box zinc finger domain-containing protein [Phthorimaea operculella]
MESLAGEEMERALMDLGPLLGVSIKEEAPDEAHEAAAATAAANGTTSEGAVASGAGTQNAVEGAEKTGADSLASPGGRACLSQTRCVLCNTALALSDGTPKLMECLHSACEPCVKAKIEEKLANANNRDFLGAERVTITCPVCRLPCQTANMIDQRFVLEKMAIEQAGSNNGGGSNAGEQQCSSCEETEPATSYCVDCAEFICESCVHAHQRLKITKDHTIKTKHEALADLHAATQNQRQSHDMFCREHPQPADALESLPEEYWEWHLPYQMGHYLAHVVANSKIPRSGRSKFPPLPLCFHRSGRFGTLRHDLIDVVSWMQAPTVRNVVGCSYSHAVSLDVLEPLE